LRDLVNDQISGLAWQKFKHLHPVQVQVLKRLNSFGFSSKVSNLLISKVNVDDLSNAWLATKKFLESQVNISRVDIPKAGGRYAFVGMPGSGKSTAIAKLLANYLQDHASSSVALISYNPRRIGGFDVITSYSRLFEVQHYLVDDVKTLDYAISQTADKQLVLIDTPGLEINHSNANGSLIKLLNSSIYKVEPILVMSAIINNAVQEQCLELLSGLNLSLVLYSMLDAGTQLGQIISTTLTNNLSVSYCSSGPRLTDLIFKPNANQIVNLVFEDNFLEKFNSNDDDLAWYYNKA